MSREHPHAQVLQCATDDPLAHTRTQGEIAYSLLDDGMTFKSLVEYRTLATIDYSQFAVIVAQREFLCVL